MSSRPVQLIWDDAHVFLTVARTGTLTAAARELGGGVATASRRIERLEAVLGVPLFFRHQTGYRLTDEGTALLPRAEAMEAAALGLAGGAEAAAEAAGRVRLATAENLANTLVIPSLPQLMATHPRLTVDILTDVASVNLHRREADLALRMVRPEAGHVACRKLGTLGFGLYGSPAYMKGRASPADDLSRDAFIGWSETRADLPAARWIEHVLAGRPPMLTTSSLAGQLSAAEAGLGLAVLPHFLARPRRLMAMEIDPGCDQEIWLVIHADLASSRRVRVVADHLAALVADRKKELAGA